MKSKLELLKEELSKLESIQSNCDHEWNKPKYDPEKIRSTYEVFVEQGSDSHYETVYSGNEEIIDRWSRICKKCGKKEYTYTLEEVAVKTIKRPKF